MKLTCRFLGGSNFMVGISPFYQTLFFKTVDLQVSSCLIFVVTLLIDF